MTNILFFIAGISLGYYLKSKATKPKTPFNQMEKGELKEVQKESKDALHERTENRKKKILEFMNSEEVHEKELGTCSLVDRTPGITCADVERLLDVSDNTARKYLKELEEEKKIKQIGESGKGVYYKKS